MLKILEAFFIGLAAIGGALGIAYWQGRPINIQAAVPGIVIAVLIWIGYLKDYLKNKKQLILIVSVTTLITSCSATGPVYNDQKGNLIIYRPSHSIYSMSKFQIDFNNETKCKLSNGGFYVTNIKDNINISASIWDIPGTSKIVAKPNSFIRVEPEKSIAFAGGAFGLLGQVVAEKSSTSGPFPLTLVPAEQAKQELKGLHQDCM